MGSQPRAASVIDESDAGSRSRVPSPAVRIAASNRSCCTSVGSSPQIALTAWPSAAISLSEVIDYLLRNRFSFEKGVPGSLTLRRDASWILDFPHLIRQ